MHKWVPTHGIYFTLRFCSQNPAPSGWSRPAAQVTPGLTRHRNLATGTKGWQIATFIIFSILTMLCNRHEKTHHSVCLYKIHKIIPVSSVGQSWSVWESNVLDRSWFMRSNLPGLSVRNWGSYEGRECLICWMTKTAPVWAAKTLHTSQEVDNGTWLIWAQWLSKLYEVSVLRPCGLMVQTVSKKDMRSLPCLLQLVTWLQV